jgi:prepilin peptidase CpaA
MNPFERPLISVENWPVLVICIGMLAAAIIDWWKFKVPNKLTFPLSVSGWLLGLANNFGLDAGQGGFGAALLGTAMGCALLIPVYAIGGMGAGDVKMTMGFGSWIGAFYGFGTGADITAADIIFYAFCWGVIIGGVIGLCMILLRGQFRQNTQHLREIVGDMFKSSGIGDIAAKANSRRPRWHRLPYGVPLCIGFLSYLAYIYNFNLVTP